MKDLIASLRKEIGNAEPGTLFADVLELCRLAERLIAAAETARHATDCPQITWAHLVLEGHRGDEMPECSCWRHDLLTAAES